MKITLYNNEGLKGHGSAVAEHFIRLSYKSNHARFFQYRNKYILQDWINSIINNNHLLDKWIFYYDRHKNIIAIGQLSLLNNDNAEIAISVEDDYQYQGYGKKLVHDLIELAKECNIKQLYITCQCINTTMLSILDKYKFTLKQEDREIIGFLDL